MGTTGQNASLEGNDSYPEKSLKIKNAKYVESIYDVTDWSEGSENSSNCNSTS